MIGGIYQDWASQEADPNRLDAVSAQDPNLPAEDAANRPAVMLELLAKRRRELQTFIGLIAKVAAKNMYAGRFGSCSETSLILLGSASCEDQVWYIPPIMNL